MRWIDSSGTSFICLESPIIILCSVSILCLCWRNPVSSKGFVLLKAAVSPNVLAVCEVPEGYLRERAEGPKDQSRKPPVSRCVEPLYKLEIRL